MSWPEPQWCVQSSYGLNLMITLSWMLCYDRRLTTRKGAVRWDILELLHWQPASRRCSTMFGVHLGQHRKNILTMLLREDPRRITKAMFDIRHCFEPCVMREQADHVI